MPNFPTAKIISEEPLVFRKFAFVLGIKRFSNHYCYIGALHDSDHLVQWRDLRFLFIQENVRVFSVPTVLEGFHWERQVWGENKEEQIAEITARK